LPILKALGFLSADGSPTQRYKDYRNHSASKAVMGEAVKEAYSDIFLIKAKPTAADKALIEGKFKSFHNTSDVVANLMTKTFYALLELAELPADGEAKAKKIEVKQPEDMDDESGDDKSGKQRKSAAVGLHYNIQIHLPAIKDVEVYNAIFKSLKDHLIE